MHRSTIKTLALICGFAAIIAASPAFNEYDLLVSFTINTARILDAMVLVVQTPTPVAGSRRATPISTIVSS
jgi:uncharacterized membrane protein YadS